MNFLNKEKKDARWLTVGLGLVLALTYAFANFNEANMMMRAMSLMMGVPVNNGYFALSLIMSTGLSYLLFILFVSMAYSIAYRTLVNKTRDLRAMPIAKESFVNHVQFVMIFTNIVIGCIELALRLDPIIATVVSIICRFVLKAGTYMIVLLLLSRVGVGENVKEKLYGGFLTPLAVLTVLMI